MNRLVIFETSRTLDLCFYSAILIFEHCSLSSKTLFDFLGAKKWLNLES